MISVATMWDDGLVSDLKLIGILKDLGLTACFAISPDKHKSKREINDARGDYGTLVSKSELKEFCGFEICNHTATHSNLNKVNLDKAIKEIVDGRKKLEDIFCRDVKGFCYPYGEYNNKIVNLLRGMNYLYARTTKSGLTTHDNLLLHPTCRWNEIDVNKLNSFDGQLILWGHTYEIKSSSDWDSILNLYTFFKENSKIKLVTFNEMMGG